MYMNIFLFLNLRVTDFPIYFAIVLTFNRIFSKASYFGGEKKKHLLGSQKGESRGLGRFPQHL